MRSTSILISLSFLLVSCGSFQVDAFKCLLILKQPLDQSYWYCKNPVTQEKKSIWLTDSDKCIRDPSQKCDWIGADVNEVESARKQLQEYCEKN